jgi:hypothetical protein
MATAKNKKVIKLNIPGIYKWESEDCSVKEAIIVMVIAMILIIILAIVLKEVALPLFMGSSLIKNVFFLIAKLKKSRAP